MKNIVSYTFALIAFGLYAQADLFVSSGSYVYVDGTAFSTATADVAPLYINDDINIASNGFIYLRNEAQLIQGSEPARNIGEGNVSVYQEGKANKWSYNYWCSPVGMRGAAAANGTFEASRMQNPTGLLSSQAFNFNPASEYDGDDTTTPINIASSWFYTFIASDEYSEWNFIGDAGTANPGLGFTMKGTSALSGGFDPNTNGQRIDFRGKANTGTIDVPVGAPVGGIGQWTLTGNPYPSAIDMRELIWDTENLGLDGIEGTPDDITTGVLNYWDQELSDNSHFIESYNGGYGTATIDMAGVVSYTAATYHMYDGAGNILGGPPTGSSKPYQPNRYIPVGQGFMVEGQAGGIFKLKNAHRIFKKESIPGDNSIFFEANNQQQNFGDTQDTNRSNSDTAGFTEEGYPAIPEDYKRFRLFVEFNELYTRELLQNFHATATDGFDYGLEAKSPEGIDSDAYWVLESTPYIIQAHTFYEALKIPLVIKLEEDMPLNLRLADLQHFEESTAVYLHDKDTNLYVNLREQNYDMILEAGNYPDRFEITFTEETLSNTVFNADDFKVFQNNDTAELTVLNPNQLEVTSVTLIDITGKQLFKDLTTTTNNRLSFSTSSLSEGVYIASVEISNSKTITEKVIIKIKL